MRLKMANAVEGCWYNLLKVVPGSLSRYSNEASVETDILKASMSISQDSSSHRFIMVRDLVVCSSKFKAPLQQCSLVNIFWWSGKESRDFP